MLKVYQSSLVVGGRVEALSIILGLQLKLKQEKNDMTSTRNEKSPTTSVIYPTTISDLDCILKSKFRFTHNTEDHSNLQSEIATNMRCIGWTQLFAKNTSVKKVLEFFNKFLNVIQEQINTGLIKPPITFYMWYDEQAFQLRFSLISGCVSNLPFGCRLTFLDEPDAIIKNFLSSKPDLQILEEFDLGDDENDEEEYTLPIFTKCLM